MARKNVLENMTAQEVADVMAIPVSRMTEEQKKIYKQVRMDNWKAKKAHKAKVWQFAKAERAKRVVAPKTETPADSQSFQLVPAQVAA